MKLFFSLFFYVLSGVGISLTLKADIGVSAFNAMNLSLSELTSIKVGTITFAVNFIFLIAYMLLTKFKFIKKYLLMLGSIICLGWVINFFTYQVFGSLVLHEYPLQVLLFLLGISISGSSTGIILYLNVLSFPIENVCVALAENSGKTFKFYRYAVDVFSVSVAFLISILWQLPFTIREGTVLSLLLFSGIISFAFNSCQRIIGTKEKQQ